MKRQPDPLQKRPPSFSRSLVTLCSSRSSSASFLLLPLSRSLSLSLSFSPSLPDRVSDRTFSKSTISITLAPFSHSPRIRFLSPPLSPPLPPSHARARSSRESVLGEAPPPRLSSFRVTHRIQVLGEGTEGRGGGYSRQGSSRRAPENKISCPLYASGRGKWCACGGRGGEKRTN